MNTAPANTTPADPTPVAKPRVLIVDDNRDSAKTLAMLLQMTGYETETAGDGASALESTASFLPQVVLLDIGLPDMTGYEVCQQLRQLPLDPQPRIVAVTGWNEDVVREQGGEACFDGHLAKPVDFKLLQKVMTG